MSIFQVEEMAPRIREVLDAPGDGWCATFEITGVQGAWAQVMKGTLNCACPLAKRPELADVLAGLPGAMVDSWEAGTSITILFDSADARTIAMAVDRLFTQFFGRGEYPVTCQIEDLEA